MKPGTPLPNLSLDEVDRLSADTLRAEKTAPFRLSSFLYSRIPILQWLPRYAPRQIIGDAIAGITVGLMVIPQGLGYATVAGVPQVYGLYSAFMGAMIYAVFGGSKDISVGPTAILSLLSFQANNGDVDIAIQMTLLSGLVQMALALCQLGIFVDFISNPVLSGFTSAAAIQIILTQIGKICGYKTRTEVYYAVYDVFHDISKTRAGDLCLGLGCMVLLHYMSKLKSKFPNSVILGQLCIGRNAVIVILTAVISYIIQASGHDCPWLLVGKVPKGMPEVFVPLPSSSTLHDQMGAVFLSAFVGFLESIAIAKAFARQNGYAHRLSSNQELFAVGLANTVGSCFRSLPVTGSFSRTAVASQAGARTQLQGAITGLVVLLALGILTPAFYYIPTTVLSAVVIVAASNLVDVSICKDLYHLGYLGRLDLVSLLISFFGCLFLDIQYGIALGIGSSLAILVYQMARPAHIIMDQNISLLRSGGVANGDSSEEDSSFVDEEAAVEAQMRLQLAQQRPKQWWNCQFTPKSGVVTPLVLPFPASSSANSSTIPSAFKHIPDSLLILRIDASLCFFNISHITSLIESVELETFSIVPLKLDDSVTNPNGDGSNDSPAAAPSHDTAGSTIAQGTLSSSLLAAPTAVQGRPPLGSVLYDPDNELGLTGNVGGVMATGAINNEGDESRPNHAISNPAPGVQGLREASPKPLAEDLLDDEDEEHNGNHAPSTNGNVDVATNLTAASAAAAASARSSSVSASSATSVSSAVHLNGNQLHVGVNGDVSPSSAISQSRRLRNCRMRVLLLDCSCVNVIDTSAVRGIFQLCREYALRAKPVTVHFACVKPHIRYLLEQALHQQAFPQGSQHHFHRSIHHAVEVILTHRPNLVASPSAFSPPNVSLNGDASPVPVAVETSFRARRQK